MRCRTCDRLVAQPGPHTWPHLCTSCRVAARDYALGPRTAEITIENEDGSDPVTFTIRVPARRPQILMTSTPNGPNALLQAWDGEGGADWADGEDWTAVQWHTLGGEE